MTNPDRSELVKLADRLAALPTFKMATVVTVPGVACNERERDLIVTALRRLASSDSGVKVRELEWSDRGVSEPRFKADAIIGTYYIERSKGGLFNWWTAATRGKIEVRTLDAAKSAAQADYEARIKSALITAPPVDAGMREALEPFAREADNWADSVSDDHRSLCTEPGSTTAHPGSETAFTVGDLRRAKAARALLGQFEIRRK